MPGPELVEAALLFAARAHDGQRRKGTDMPYLVHPVGVMLALVQAGETDPELLAAALLHDTVEDTGVSLAQLREHFGERVARIVEGCSEPDKSDTWEHRKQHTVSYLRTAPRDTLLVSAADKLNNVLSMRADHAELGERLWSRFKRGRAETAWYYRAVTDSLLAGELRQHPLILQLVLQRDFGLLRDLTYDYETLRFTLIGDYRKGGNRHEQEKQTLGSSSNFASATCQRA